MHETARHAIHSFETLNVSVGTMETMQQQVLDIPTTHKRGGSGRTGASRQIQIHIDCQVRMLRSLYLRSQSNKERLQNEIALVMVDTLAIQRASADIAAGVQHDRAARQPSNERPGRSSKSRQ
jgi:hypothetical protein